MAKKSAVFARMLGTAGRPSARPAFIIVVIVAVFVASPGFSAEATDGRDNQVVTLRLLPIADDATRKQLWETLARIAQPVTLEVPAKVSIPNAVRARCGSAPTELLQILAELNPGLKEISDEGRQLSFIPCPYWAFPKSSATTKAVPIRKGESISKVLPLYMGTAGNDTLATVRKLNQKILDANGTAVDNGFIRIPYMTRPFSFRLREGVKQTPEEVARQLKKKFPMTMPPALFDANTSDAGQDYQLVVECGPTAEDAALYCDGPIGGQKWPFNQGRIEAIYEEMRQQLKGAVTTPIVVVADTGVDLSNSDCSRIIWTNPRFAIGFGSPYGGGPHGKNVVANNSDIAPTPGYEFADHGTEVVSILGGDPFAPSKSLDGFKVAVTKITSDRKPFDIPAAAVSESFLYAREVHASVLNLSVVVASAVGSLVDGLRAGNFLVIAAAGNHCTPVESLRVYPPAMNQYRDNLIVVGAHDWKNRLAYFSNSGQLVDLLAPGCDVPVRGKDGETLSLSGTSFAAPFVTFTAALLSSFGMTSNEIKNRILATVDFDEELIETTKSAGRLNIENALAIKDDILVLKDASGRVAQLRGDLDPSQYWTCTGPSEKIYSPHMVGRVVPNYRGSKAKVWERVSFGDFLPVPECDSLEGEVVFRQKGSEPSSPFTSYNWSDVITVIPKLLRR